VGTGLFKHLVVLMLENRSFDHLLGFSGVVDPPPQDELYACDLVNEPNCPFHAHPTPSASYIGDLAVDPGHSYEAVLDQLTINGCNKGFVYSYARQAGTSMQSARAIMRCVGPNRLPALQTLAKEFTLYARWFSSMPGPTIPNRMFAHLGTANGNVEMEWTWYTRQKYQGNSVYGLLRQAVADEGSDAVPYRIYSSGGISLALVLEDVLTNLDDSVASFSDFLDDVKHHALPQYSFVEPLYGDYLNEETFRQIFASDQHPDHDLRAGDHLVADVYEAIRNSEHWNDTALLITYDEHGGLYDRETPGPAVPPEPWDGKSRFKFDRLGIRVPAILVSKYSPSYVDSETIFDHASIPATALQTFAAGYIEDLGLRVKSAASFLQHTDVNKPRDDAPRRLTRVPLRWSRVHATRSQGRLMTEHQRALVDVANHVADELSLHGVKNSDRSTIRTEQDGTSFVRRVARHLPMQGARKSRGQ
jgi:phospholipase C